MVAPQSIDEPIVAVNGEEAAVDIKTANGKDSRAKANSTSSRTEDDPSRRRVWLVRVPKPPEVAAIKALDVEVETYKAQVRLFSETLNVKRLERDAIRDNVRTARDAMRRCREAFDAKNATLEPLRESLRAGGAASRKLREEFADLEARTEEELDSKLAALNHRIEHESIPLREEKAIIASIKKLESQRQRIRDFQATAGVATEARADVGRVKAELAEHDAELRMLRAERETQGAILTKFREQEAAIDAEFEAIIAERQRIKELQDAAYNRVAEVRRVQKARNDVYYANRRFSRTVRDAIAGGNIEEALRLCMEQRDETHAKLATDDDYRAEYFALWEQQRKAPNSILGADDDDEAAAPVNGNGKAARKKELVPEERPAEKAQALIAAVLEDAVNDLQRANNAASEETLAPAAAAAAAAASVAVSSANSDDGVAAAAPAAKPLKKKETAAAAASRAYVVEPVVEPVDNFELPAVIKEQQSAGQAAVDKAAERERNRQLQQEAEERKQRRELEKSRRKEKAAAAAAAAAAQEAAAQAKALKAAAAAKSAEAAAKAAAAAAAAKAAAELAAASAEGTNTTAATRATKRPLGAKRSNNGSLIRQLRAYYRDNEMQATGVLIATVLFFLAYLYSTA